MDETELYEKLIETARELQKMGYVVVVFTPDEIGEHSTKVLEEVVIARGNEFLSE